MPGNDLGPPEKEDRPPDHRKPIDSISGHHATPTSTKRNTSGRQAAYDVQAGLRRGHEAKLRSAPIGICGCIRDPGRDRHRCGDEITDVMVNAYEHAAAHLLEHGLTPAPNREGLRLMWQRGGHSRQAAELIASRWELAG